MAVRDRDPESLQQRRDLDLGAIVLDRLDHRRPDLLGRGRAETGRCLDPGVGEHPGVADEPRQHHRDPDARARAGPRAARARSREGRTWSPCRGSCAEARPCPTARRRRRGDPAPRSSIAGITARAILTGASRLTRSAAITSSSEAPSRRPPAEQAGVGDEDVDRRRPRRRGARRRPPRRGRRRSCDGPVPASEPPSVVELGALSRAQHERGAPPGERLGDRPTEAAGRPGEQDRLARELHRANLHAARRPARAQQPAT